jgi:diaminopimelate epimerase
MDIKFSKYQGTGNDFVMVDNRNSFFPKKTGLIAAMCDRRFGVGADGLILLENDLNYDFKMVYYNADGRESTMCGNGGRCLVQFAKHLGLFGEECTFLAIDGVHKAKIKNELVHLQMKDVDQVEVIETNKSFRLDTGSPHYVRYVKGLKNYDVFGEGRAIRNSANFKKEGINVNFIEDLGTEGLFVRTYERGVEDETYSCGTGVTAAALANRLNGSNEPVSIKTIGGRLSVSFQKNGEIFQEIYLIGEAKFVFRGKYPIDIHTIKKSD